jgi:hypothetical protein
VCLVVLDEMAARRSITRLLNKFQAQAMKPVAVLTAFQGERTLADNRAAKLLQKYGQFFAMMKLPSTPQVFLLRSDGQREFLGSEIAARTRNDPYYTQLKSGPRADSSMLSLWESLGERGLVKRFIN